MPENEFEKQVQQKMDELQFVPSDAVWPEVERQITERKKRRGLIFWLPLGVLLLGGAAWMFFSGNANNAITKQAADKTIANTSAKNKNQTANTPATTNAAGNDNKKTAAGHAAIPATTAADAGVGSVGKHKTIVVEKPAGDKDQNHNHSPRMVTLSTAISNKTNTAADKNNGSSKYKNVDKTTTAVALAKNRGRKHIAAAVVEKEKTNTTVGSAIEEKEEAVEQSLPQKKEVTPAEPLADTVAAKALTVKKTETDSSGKVNKVDSSKAIAKTKTTNKTKKKIEWGINVHAGSSSVSDGFSSLFSSTPTYDASAFLSNQPSAPGNNVNAGATAASKPSDTKAGFSYGAGLFISKTLNKKLNLLAGVNYAYYSNRINVGAKSDSLGFVLYQTGNFSSYTNRFHFIEIPVAIQFHGKRFALNTGLSFSMLAGSNTLLYKAQGNYYYKDNSLVNKMQLGVLAGFSYRLFPATMPVEIGPQINYNLTNIFNKDLYGSRHLFFGGINAKVFLHKK